MQGKTLSWAFRVAKLYVTEPGRKVIEKEEFVAMLR